MTLVQCMGTLHHQNDTGASIPPRGHGAFPLPKRWPNGPPQIFDYNAP